MKQKCIVGLSGGVDSSTSAAIMKERGYEVIGCTFRMVESDGANLAIADAKRVADYLGIEHEVVDCVADFRRHVVDYFVQSYEVGVTPNPCIMCNKFLKFKYLEELKERRSADMIATGHYARLRKIGDKVELLQAASLERDQSYFLYRVDGDILKHTEFPLGDYHKSHTRELAAKFGIHVAEKSDSQDVCFIPNGDYAAFIRDHSSGVFSEGEIVNENGEVLGRHEGLVNYTVGQRKGLGLSGGPFFVKRLNVGANQVVVSDKNGVGMVKIDLKSVVFIEEPRIGDCQVKIRSTTKKIDAKIVKNSDEYSVILAVAEYGVAGGQHCVFYDRDKVLGGGVIC
ncbi:MAG: tRNA 2-thiouridine(34) synthase MnmA [Holosporaceae bacterium]|jgi:tRNA-specific 2-thiouridylase|nr:tRNA 2-thiouridine(34) synthase MnmA [Holosporaceae bacterium]